MLSGIDATTILHSVIDVSHFFSMREGGSEDGEVVGGICLAARLY